MNKWHVETAAEAMAAAQFARFGYDVSVQYGANQPEYDLIVVNERGQSLKISVKGSVHPGWGLSQRHLVKGNGNYHQAADDWNARHKPGTVLCLVTFHGVTDEQLPRMYLARPTEIAQRLKQASGGCGDTILFENKTRGPRAKGAGTTEKLPQDWLMTRQRVADLLGSTS